MSQITKKSTTKKVGVFGTGPVTGMNPFTQTSTLGQVAGNTTINSTMANDFAVVNNCLARIQTTLGSQGLTAQGVANTTTQGIIGQATLASDFATVTNFINQLQGSLGTQSATGTAFGATTGVTTGTTAGVTAGMGVGTLGSTAAQAFGNITGQSTNAQIAFDQNCNWELFEDAKSYNLCVELAGVAKADLQVAIAQGSVIIQGTKTSAFQTATNAVCLVNNSTAGAFRLQFVLTPVADALDTKQVTCVLEHGVLNITVAKTKVAAQTVATVKIL